MNKKPILTICPSRQRIKKLKIMVKSFFETSSLSDLLIINDFDDPQINEYKDFFIKSPEILTLTINAKNNSDRFNVAVKDIYPNYKFYHVTNDDMIYKTNKWDKIFVEILGNKIGIIYGNDGFFGEKLCVAPMISGEIIRLFGWIHLPQLEYLYADNVWMILGQISRCLYYVENVLIEHTNPICKGQKETDETFNKTNSKECYEKDSKQFMNWCGVSAIKESKRIINLINSLKEK